MGDHQSKIEALFEFRNTDKFSAEKWEARGLCPSDDIICEMMTLRFYYTADELIKALVKNSSLKKQKRILRQRLGTFKRSDFDTEEREFIADLFYDLAILLGIDFKRNLNRWLYGRVIVILMDIMKIIRPRKIVKTQKQPCISCGMSLEIIFYNTKQRGVSYWVIGKCSACNEYNLFDVDGSSRRLQYNFFPVESLSKEEYTYEQAQIRFEQIKFFRK